MTLLCNDPARFTEDALAGFVDAYADVVRLVPGGVVRARPAAPGTVAVVVGGGSGHYPAFCGLVGPGFAHGAVVGNVFTSPSADDVTSVCRAADAGAGVVMLTGNYAGDVMNFTLAARRLADEGIDARYVLVTDDVASAPVGEEGSRRGIAGDLTVFKVAAAAAGEGRSLDEVEALARHANDRTRTMGVAFDGCTLPGAHEPLFTVPEGRMGVGVGIHGEPGIGETEMPSATALAQLLVERVLAERPDGAERAAVVLNGLGRTKYEELFVVWATVAALLREAGVQVVAPDVGELVTSLDMAGCSLTAMWLDEDLERLWRAPAAAPAYRKGSVLDAGPAPDTSRTAEDAEAGAGAETETPAEPEPVAAASDTDRAAGRAVLTGIEAALDAVRDQEEALGRLDAFAGDGDHGRGMVRGLSAAHEAASAAVGQDAGAAGVLTEAGRAWAGRAGGTSGVIWGAMLEAAGGAVRDREVDRDLRAALGAATAAAVDAAQDLGKAQVGDKTLLDALVPFRDRLTAGDGDGAARAWASAVAVAEQAAQDTAGLRPRVGRARPLAEQSVGHPDPGAVSLALVLRAVGEAVR